MNPTNPYGPRILHARHSVQASIDLLMWTTGLLAVFLLDAIWRPGDWMYPAIIAVFPVGAMLSYFTARRAERRATRLYDEHERMWTPPRG